MHDFRGPCPKIRELYQALMKRHVMDNNLPNAASCTKNACCNIDIGIQENTYNCMQNGAV